MDFVVVDDVVAQFAERSLPTPLIYGLNYLTSFGVSKSIEQNEIIVYQKHGLKFSKLVKKKWAIQSVKLLSCNTLALSLLNTFEMFFHFWSDGRAIAPTWVEEDLILDVSKIQFCEFKTLAIKNLASQAGYSIIMVVCLPIFLHLYHNICE